MTASADAKRNNGRGKLQLGDNIESSDPYEFPRPHSEVASRTLKKRSVNASPLILRKANALGRKGRNLGHVHAFLFSAFFLHREICALEFGVKKPITET